MRSSIIVAVVAVACLLVYVALLSVSARLPQLPTSHHAEWVALLKEPGAGRVHLDLIHAGTQWYERAVLFNVAAAAVAFAARLKVSRRSSIVGGVFLWLAAMVLMTGRPNLLDCVAVVISIVGARGGMAIAEDILKRRRGHFAHQIDDAA